MTLATVLLLVVYCLLVAAVSYVGGWLPSLLKLTHTRLQITMSLVAGLMLGVGLWHLLPHGIGELQIARVSAPVDTAMWWTSVGLLTMFFLIRVFHIHHHGPVEEAQEEQSGEDKAGGPVGHVHGPGCDHAHEPNPGLSAALPIVDGLDDRRSMRDSSSAAVPTVAAADSCNDPQHDHDHAHHHHHGHGHEEVVIPEHPLAWIGLFFGLAVHTLIDGIALGASVAAESRGEAGSVVAGLGAFLAIALHKPLDALSITSLMAAGGWSDEWRHYVNIGFALVCPVGAILFVFGVDQLGEWRHLIVGGALCFAAGVFLCISLGDLLPELHFHAHDRVPLSIALLVGLVIAFGIKYLEPPHVHGPVNGHNGHQHGHDHPPHHRH